MRNTRALFRPVGEIEMELIRASGFTRFPPRLPGQPIFYPVAVQGYAEQIAREWNAKEPGHVGYVVRFDVDETFIDRYPVRQVGNKTHLEYWIPAEDLGALNAHIVGRIRIIYEYRVDV